MTLRADIVSTRKPDKNSVLQAFASDNRTHGKTLKSFTSVVNNTATHQDPYTSHFNLHADHYDVEAVFE